jgi:hypothetical protein
MRQLFYGKQLHTLSGEGIMRDVLFRYENNSTNKEGVYFDMDANGIKEKMLTWTDPNQWMVVKDINGDGVINSGREVVGNHMTLPNGTKAADTIQALSYYDTNKVVNNPSHQKAA